MPIDEKQDEERITTGDVGELTNRVHLYLSQLPFEVKVELHNPNFSVGEIAEAERRGYQIVTERLQPLHDAWRLFQTEMKCYAGGPDEELRLTGSQKDAYARAKKTLEEMDTKVRVYLKRRGI